MTQFLRDQASDQAVNIKLLRPGLDKTRLFISLTAGAGTRCMSIRSSPPSLFLVFSGGEEENYGWLPGEDWKDE